MNIEQMIDQFSVDPDSYKGPIVQHDVLVARIAVIERVLESWKGKTEYAETIRMEIWALRLAAAMIMITGRAIDEASSDAAFEPSAEDRDRMIMSALEGIIATAATIRGG